MDTSFSVQQIDTNHLQPWAKQPRQIGRLDADADLDASIRAKGIQTPLIVRPSKGGAPYEIVAGERRWRAAKALGIHVLPVIVRELTDTEAREVALIENLQRKDMNVVDIAEAYRALRDGKPPKSIAAIAAAVGKSEHHVYRMLRLFALETGLLDALRLGALSMEHAEVLMQLPAPRRKEAVSLTGRGVVWSRSPLLEFNERWVPSAEDLQPIHKLRAFQREHAAFDPLSDDTKHFQPELTQQITQELDVDEAHGTADVIAAATSTVLRLSEDPLVRMRLGAAKNDKGLPLSPSHWKEVKPGSCEHAELGVVVQGGPYRVVPAACASRRCEKHWPKPKKKPASGSAAKKASASKLQETWEQKNARHKAERQAAQARWTQVLPEAKRRILEHVESLSFNVVFVATLLNAVDSWNGLSQTNAIERAFGVQLNPSTLAQVLALSTIGIDDREDFATSTKPWRFDMKPIDAALAKLEGAKKAAAKKPAAKKGGKK